MSVESLIDVDSFSATEFGFTCNCGGQPRRFQDEDVIGLRVRKERTLSKDGTARTREWLSIRVLDRSVPIIEVQAEYSGPHDNFVAPFRDRLLKGLTAHAMATLHREDEFDGGPWAIGPEGLIDKEQGTRIPLESVSRIGWRDGRFCFWQKGSDQVAVSFSAEEENSYLLAPLASKLLLFEVSEHDQPDAELGRDVYEFRDTSSLAQIAMGVAGGTCVVLAIGAVKLALAGQLMFFAALGAAAVVTLAAIGLVYWKVATPCILRLSDNTLALIHRGHEMILPLDDLAEFTAEWTDYYRNSVYQQTRVHFELTSDDRTVPPWTYDALATYGAPKFDELQGFQAHVAAVVARRMYDELISAGRVFWTPRLAILSNGVEFTKKAGVEPRTFAFTQITQWEVDQGLLKLAIDGTTKPNFVEKTNQPNFYPGLALFTQLLGAPGSTGTIAATGKSRDGWN